MFRTIAIATAGGLMPEIMSQKQAVSLGLKHYYTGSACRRGHFAARRTADGNCLECNRLRNIKYRSGNRDRIYQRAIPIAIAAALAIWALLARPAHSASPCMSKVEARHEFETSHIYWHGEDRCWDATPPHRHARHHEPDSQIGVPLPPADLRKAQALLASEPETDLVTATPWKERWTDVAQVVPAPKPVVVRKLEPMVVPRDVIAVFLTTLLSIALIEVVFGRRINEHLRRRRHRGFGT